ncbi:MAG: hypothetical protein Q9220_006454 [cf. Caloplaca sp. 1 TL-2023]
MNGVSDEDSRPRLPFPPVTRSHILHCSYHSWHPKYRSITPKARLIPLPSSFLTYLRSDGIILPPSRPSTPPPPTPTFDTDTDSGIFSASSSANSSDTEIDDPSQQWPDLHAQITSTVALLGGNVLPKLNWSAPKDAVWINATNSMECRSANDVYLLLKSSDFVTHDLEQVFDGCSPSPSSCSPTASSETRKEGEEIPYHLILRKTIPSFLPSCEFRIFVRHRRILAICQRDLNFYDFLPALVPGLRDLMMKFFDSHLKSTFEDGEFVFDVYIPPPHTRCWLIDINPWAMRTDPLLFSWMELLGMPGDFVEGRGGDGEGKGVIVNGDATDEDDASNDEEEEEEEDVEPEIEFRLVRRDDPEAYAFNTPRYSAHKMPKDVVDAGVDGEAGIREFIGRWREVERVREGGGDSDDDEES